MVESTALLAAQDVEVGSTPLSDNGANDHQSESGNSAKEGRGRLLCFIRILRVHALIISLFNLFLLLAIRFILYHAPLHNFGLYRTKLRTTILAAWVRTVNYTLLDFCDH